MSISRFVNGVLSHVNVAITKRSTVNQVAAELRALREEPDCALLQRLAIESDERFRELLRHQIAQKWSLIDQFAKSPKHEMRACPLCGHEAHDQEFKKYYSHCIFGGGNLLRHECPFCNVIFGPDKVFNLSEQELDDEYEWHYKAYQEGDSTELELKAFHALNPSRSGVYVNYGAGGWSQTVQRLRDEGWNVYAFEPYGSAAHNTEYLINSYDKLALMRFDGIFSNNVLEHLRHPNVELTRLAELLKEGGRMSHATPCFEYLYEYTRFHLFFYVGKSRELLMEKAGLEMIDYVDEGIFKCCVVRPRAR